jgi:hypothetical protein
MIAETILGAWARSARRGMLYKSYDMGEVAAAESFAELALHFAAYEGDDDWHRKRAQKALDLCVDIKRELGIQ